jgi:hypothetical protein
MKLILTDISFINMFGIIQEKGLLAIGRVAM